MGYRNGDSDSHLFSSFFFTGDDGPTGKHESCCAKKKGRVESYGIGLSCDDKGSYMLHVVAVMLMTLQIMMEL